jgi:hypothetical protein
MTIGSRQQNTGFAMTETSTPLRPLWRQVTWWTLAFPIVMIVALARHDIYLLNWIHVLSGALWTGADLFMGFILGPTLRMLDMRARTALIAYLVPRTLLYFPMVSLTAGTTGWFLADWFGFYDASEPYVLFGRDIAGDGRCNDPYGPGLFIAEQRAYLARTSPA